MPQDPYQQFKHLTPAEQDYVKRHPMHVPAIKRSRDLAFAEARRTFGINGHNDESDASRHCFWSAILTRDIGYQYALAFTTAHETSPTNPPAERAMDLHNNAVGLEIGRQGGSDPSLSNACMAAWKAGRLKVLK
jgi:hypothetical protein